MVFHQNCASALLFSYLLKKIWQGIKVAQELETHPKFEVYSNEIRITLILTTAVPRKCFFYLIPCAKYCKISCDFICNFINPFHAPGLFLYPKTSGFLMFSGGIERDRWHKMD